MKSIPTLAVAATMLLAVACSQSPSTDQAAADSTAAPGTSEPVAQPVTIVTWKEIGVRETPSERGKYLTSVYLGEHLQATGDTASEKSGSKRNHYHKVTLSDGKTGWVRDEFIAIDVYPAVIIHDAQIMKRPDAATVTDKRFMTGDFVVVKKREGQFIEVTGKIFQDKWYTTGFVRSDNLSYADIEIQYATLRLRYYEETKENIKSALLAQMEDQTVFGNSLMYAADHPEEGEGEEDPGYGIPPVDLAPPTDGLVGYYPLNSVEALDASGLGNDGTKHGDVGIDYDMAGFTEGAMSFNGESYVSIPATGDKVTLPFTVVAYFKLADTDLKDQCVVSRGRSRDGTGFNFGYTVTDAGAPTAYLGVVGTRPMGPSVQVTFEVGDWIYLAGTFNEKEAKLYINGKEVDSITIPEEEAGIIAANLANSNEPLEIGRELATLNRYFRGSIDNVAVWNRVLSAEEIAAMAR
jgi:hypothetical protein